MASAVGPKRAWSRAMLFKLRRGAKHRALARKIRAGAKRKREVSNKEGFELKRANDLRRTVPGGEAMDFCSLLEETAHYIKCLTNQVYSFNPQVTDEMERLLLESSSKGMEN
ncbi:hypothetical protein HHK36_027191 [Tetracentron sinense]|uniref:Uncharacterized protein n=1 Tax=Tetracentron sinense TaxID=13715 RepID=A0A835D3B9_TETSI|nr:hypothetical protein HHK36_027191 [Tetracentron sinense]